MDPLLLHVLVVVLTLLGALAALWFFQTRRIMIARMKRIVEILEEQLKPRDKSYTLLGYLVGFRAVYRSPRIPGVEKAWILYTQPPRHVLLYLPFIHLAGARERMELTLQLHKPPVPGEAHLYQPRDRATRREVSRDTQGKRLHSKEITIAGVSMRLLYNSETAAEAVIRLAERAAAVAGEPPLRVTASHDLRALHIAFDPRLSSLEKLLALVKREARRVGG